MKKVLICAAMPQELKFIRRNLSKTKGEKRSYGAVFSTLTNSAEVTLLRTGVGTINAESSIKSLLRKLHPDLIMSLGFGGALYEGLVAGDLIWASRVFFLRTPLAGREPTEISHISLPEAKKIADKIPGSIFYREGCIVTLEHFMGKHEIRKSLPDGVSFPVCDMETFVLAKTAMERRIPFFAARSVSDTASQEIPRELFDITDEWGNIAYLSLIKSVLQKPGLAKDVLLLEKNSLKAAKSLAAIVKSFLDTVA